jgi:hypothetical protein
MKTSRLVSTVLAAAAVAGGISFAVAQTPMTRTPEQDTGTKKDIESTGAMRPRDPAPAPMAAAAAPAPAAPMAAAAPSPAPAPMTTTTEPAAQPTRG